jgi:hypothetical protein
MSTHVGATVAHRDAVIAALAAFCQRTAAAAMAAPHPSEAGLGPPRGDG